jgi:hypothetical protein
MSNQAVRKTALLLRKKAEKPYVKAQDKPVSMFYEDSSADRYTPKDLPLNIQNRLNKRYCNVSF